MKNAIFLEIHEKTVKISVFSHFCQKAYPIPGAFRHFGHFDTTAPPLDTTSGRVDESVTNPYPNPEENSKINVFYEIFHQKVHFSEYQVCR